MFYNRKKKYKNKRNKLSIGILGASSIIHSAFSLLTARRSQAGARIAPLLLLLLFLLIILLIFLLPLPFLIMPHLCILVHGRFDQGFLGIDNAFLLLDPVFFLVSLLRQCDRRTREVLSLENIGVSKKESLNCCVSSILVIIRINDSVLSHHQILELPRVHIAIDGILLLILKLYNLSFLQLLFLLL